MSLSRTTSLSSRLGTCHYPLLVLGLLSGLVSFAVLAVSPLLSSSGQAHAQVGLTSAPFLRIEPDARASALGGSGVTLLDEGFGGYYNPASLGWQRGISAGFSYSNWLAGITSDMRYNRFAGTYELDDRSTVAASLSYVNLGEQMATDDRNTQLGAFSNYQMVTGLSYGRLMSRYLALGLGVKHIYSSLGAGQSVQGQGIDPGSSLALDGGLLWRSPDLSLAGRQAELRLGAALANVGPGLRYMDAQSRISLPQSFRGGAALAMNLDRAGDHSLTLSTDLTRLLARMERSVVAGDTTWASMSPLKALIKGWGDLERFNGQEVVRLGFAEQFGLGLGAEYWFRGLFAVRGGYYQENPDNGDRKYISAGAGLRYMGAEIDFSWLSSIEQDHPLDGTMRVSLRLHLNGGYKAPRAKGQVDRIRVYEMAPTLLNPAIAADSLRARRLAAEALAVRAGEQATEQTGQAAQAQTGQEIPGQTTMSPLTPAAQAQAALLSQAALDLEALADGLVPFATMSSNIEAENAEVLARVVVALQRYPEFALTITGYTDAKGSAVLNEMLSEARARALALEILSYGVIPAERLAIEGLASADSVASNATEAGRQANRRGQFRISQPGQNIQPGQGPQAIPLQGSLAELPDWLATEDRTQESRPLLPIQQGVANQGTELAFTWLEPADPAQARLWLRSLTAHLEQNPGQELSIAAYVNYAGSSQSFLSELAKARAEKLKSLLIALGTAQERITILSPDDATWQQTITPILPQGNAERVWFLVD